MIRKNLLLLLTGLFSSGFCTSEYDHSENIPSSRLLSYVITEDDLTMLKTPDEVYSILEKQIGILYPDTTSMLNAIEKDLTDFPEYYPQIATIIRGQAPLDITLDPDSCTQPDAWICKIKTVSLNKKSFQLIKKELEKLSDFPKIPETLIPILSQLENVHFPDSVLFRLAMIAKLNAALGTCQANTEINDPYNSYLRLDDKSYKLLIDEWKSNQLVSSSIFNKIDLYRKKVNLCSLEEQASLRQHLETIYSAYFQAFLNLRFAKYYPYNQAFVPRWTSNTCGCLVQELNGIVYGFFPYWYTSGEKQVLPFSTISRIAYYSLTFNDHGDLIHPNNPDNITSIIDQNNDSIHHFIQVVHDHHSKLDWVIEKSSWPNSWSKERIEDRRKFFQKLNQNIIHFVTTPISTSFQKGVKKITYCDNELNTKGDGITLYIRNYPTDSISTQLFIEFFQNLKRNLHEASPDYYLNFLISQLDLQKGKGIYGYRGFLNLVQSGDQQTNLFSEEELLSHVRNYLLVLVNEPSGFSEKVLRSQIDFLLQGENRNRIMRSMVPVFIFDYQNWKQLREDLIYSNDAFYGFGFWPVQEEIPPHQVDSCIQGGSVSQCILENFEIDNASHKTQSMLGSFVCRHRLLFRLALTITIGIMIVMLTLLFFYCSLQARLRKYLLMAIIALILPPFTIFSLLFLYDPALTNIFKGGSLFILIPVVFIIGAGLFTIHKNQRTIPNRRILKSSSNH